jgi:DNA-directed RNA polymerase specialized sigma24 family protein
MALIETPWFKGVIHNYILRFRRRSYWRYVREGRPLEETPEPQSSQPLESEELLDRVAAALPKRERKLLALIRCGYSMVEASKLLGIPPGSRAYHQGQLIAYARRVMKRRNILPQKDH